MDKIIFILTGLDYAGAEAQVIQLAIGLQLRGWLVQVISMIKPTAYVEELDELGIELFTLNMKKGIPDPRAINKLKQIIQKFNPDIVHSHMIHANILARVTRVFVKIPVLVSTAHSNNEGGKTRMLLYRATDSLCEITTNVSQDAVQSYIQKKACPANKIMFVPNGINLKQFNKNEQDYTDIRSELGLKDEFVWLAVGRLVEVKDYHTLVTAFSEIVKRNSHCRLIIVGEGILRATLEAYVRSLHMENHIKFLGIRKDIPRLMNASDAFVISSIWEGMPMVLLEASASELPMVATDVGGNGEVVEEEVSGYLARPIDAPDLSQKMQKMMSLTKEERTVMGKKGREFVLAKYDINAIILRWESIYSDLFKTKAQDREVERVN
ncbi:glycosyltransferase [Paenibacillus qinlingensis]|uniref:Glycosyltransferase involved in cell wall biosynthesis n=1 Tax=Paenibacillus qinlingensis TaxID=1837343 RepID=A0ABU1P298_9BACL|nr:glycosyltransferase [Paenibacillus qinlingensis]MDR6553875.1 glycosyltransferase involved in cell wall biosynthesis [Paenibacillus qinlingensis]